MNSGKLSVVTGGSVALLCEHEALWWGFASRRAAGSYRHFHSIENYLSSLFYCVCMCLILGRVTVNNRFLYKHFPLNLGVIAQISSLCHSFSPSHSLSHFVFLSFFLSLFCMSVICFTFWLVYLLLKLYFIPVRMGDVVTVLRRKQTQ